MCVTVSQLTFKSSGTSGLAFSLMVRLALVCCTKKLARPTSNCATSGSCRTSSRVTTWQPRGKPCSATVFCTLRAAYLYISTLYIDPFVKQGHPVVHHGYCIVLISTVHSTLRRTQFSVAVRVLMVPPPIFKLNAVVAIKPQLHCGVSFKRGVACCFGRRQRQRCDICTPDTSAPLRWSH